MGLDEMPRGNFLEVPNVNKVMRKCVCVTTKRLPQEKQNRQFKKP
jgi:hypothetical protein